MKFWIGIEFIRLLILEYCDEVAETHVSKINREITKV